MTALAFGTLCEAPTTFLKEVGVPCDVKAESAQIIIVQATEEPPITRSVFRREGRVYVVANFIDGQCYYCPITDQVKILGQCERELLLVHSNADVRYAAQRLKEKPV